MASQGLREFYDTRYAHEAEPAAARVCQQKAVPTSGIEAAVHYLPRHFRRGHILELGAGDGTLARSLIAHGLSFDSYTLTEFSEPRLEGLRKTVHDPRVRVVRMDAEALPEEELGRYDTVVMIAVIEHLLDPMRAMKRVRLLLKPGGFVYLDTPNIAKYTRRLKLVLGRFPATSASHARHEGLGDLDGDQVDLFDGGHLHYFTFRSLRVMLTTRCGFTRITKLPYHCGRNLVGRRLHHYLACLWPGMFSELAILAHRSEEVRRG